jgi:hypothetical protein
MAQNITYLNQLEEPMLKNIKTTSYFVSHLQGHHKTCYKDGRNSSHHETDTPREDSKRPKSSFISTNDNVFSHQSTRDRDAVRFGTWLECDMRQLESMIIKCSQQMEISDYQSQ